MWSSCRIRRACGGILALLAAACSGPDGTSDLGGGRDLATNCVRSGCPSGFCDVDSGQCRECLDDTDCRVPSAPRCDPANGHCVACLPQSSTTTDNCPAGMYCMKGSSEFDPYRCVQGCSTDDPCSAQADGGGALVCCVSHCVDTRQDHDHCGGCGKACDPGLACCGMSCVDTSTRLAHCGGCDKVCNPAHVQTALCTNASCGFDSCLTGYANCDNDDANGCEASTTSDPLHCGGCNGACAPAHVAQAQCKNSSCDYDVCVGDWRECDGLRANGCEINIATNALHCGGCNQACPTPTRGTARCSGGQCKIASCDSGWGDCDNDIANGCETHIDSDPARCGSSCATAIACSSSGWPNVKTYGCAGGACTIVECQASYRDCALLPGCETDVTTSLSHCGDCNHPCPPLNHVSPVCLAGQCQIASCDLYYADCNQQTADGCEVYLQDSTTCGTGCADTVDCAANAWAHVATYKCPSASCMIERCASGWDDCDADDANGCESPIYAPTTCGTQCTNRSICSKNAWPNVATYGCPAGACAVAACSPGWGDCDFIDANGCEATFTAVATCGTSCADIVDCATKQWANVSTYKCPSGSCDINTCVDTWRDCDGDLTTGCETDTAVNMAHCGGCNQACSPQNVENADCAGSACGYDQCKPGFYECDTIKSNGCESTETCTTVLVLSDSYYIEDTRSTLAAANAFPTVDAFNTNSATPTLADLAPYTAVLYYVGSWGYPGPQDPTAIGDVLAAYFENGGRVVLMQDGLKGPYSDGAFFDLANGYLLLTKQGDNGNAQYDYLGVVYEPSSLLMADVDVNNVWANANSIYDHHVINPATTSIVARWRDSGYIMVVRGVVTTPQGPRVRVDLNMSGELSQAGEIRLVANALKFH